MTRQGDRVGLAGFGCLVALALAGLLGGLGLLVAGAGVFIGAAGDRVSKVEQAYALTGTLERSVILCGFGALALLVGIVASVVLMKELGDDASRAARGPVQGGE